MYTKNFLNFIFRRKRKEKPQQYSIVVVEQRSDMSVYDQMIISDDTEACTRLHYDNGPFGTLYIYRVEGRCHLCRQLDDGEMYTFEVLKYKGGKAFKIYFDSAPYSEKTLFMKMDAEKRFSNFCKNLRISLGYVNDGSWKGGEHYAN